MTIHHIDAERENGGFKSQIRETVRAFLVYLQTRAHLFALEAREASTQLGNKAIYFAVGGAFLFLGYVLLLAAAIPMMALAFKTDWQVICLIVALLHLLGGGVMFYLAKKWFSNPMFEATLKELEKDQRWLALNVPSRNKKQS